LDVETLLNK